MRTVKSCVGSTWCRYGVQDSVGMAIDIENRYRGPARAAQDQARRVGLHARVRRGAEQGRRRHRDGEGLEPLRLRQRRHEAAPRGPARRRTSTRPTLVRYIDRFLMFYIRTADRLQRTSTWLDNLEGGLDYVKQVVCEDKLGIGAELEADMARVIATYECEWKRAVEDPQTLKRFRHFVNSGAGGRGREVREGARAEAARASGRNAGDGEMKNGTAVNAGRAFADGEPIGKFDSCRGRHAPCRGW